MIFIIIWTYKSVQSANIKFIKNFIKNEGYNLESISYYPEGRKMYSDIIGACYKITYYNDKNKFENKLCFCSRRNNLIWIDYINTTNQQV